MLITPKPTTNKVLEAKAILAPVTTVTIIQGTEIKRLPFIKAGTEAPEL